MNDKTLPQGTSPRVASALSARSIAHIAAEGRIARRTGALFKALSSDFLLREQFVTDPAQVMGEYVFGERPDENDADAANQLIYAVLSHPGLRDWLLAYARHAGGEAPQRDAFAHAFAKAVARAGDDATVLSLIRGGAEHGKAFVLQADLLRSLIGLLGAGGASNGTEMSPGGTEMSPGTGGTEMSPGAIFRGPGSVFRGTEMSPGGTEMSPGTGGTEMSPGAIFRGPGTVFSGTEMSPGTGGTEMSPGTGGTEMSPGTGGTEMSPGTGGTEMSPGAFGGWQLAAQLRVSFAALVHYSTQLRARGALGRSGL